MTLTDTFIAVPPPLRFAEDGRVIRVGNTRVPLDTVIGEFNDGASAEEVVLAYDCLSLADVSCRNQLLFAASRTSRAVPERAARAGR